jgi:predicted double-glycine peptidase
MKIQCLVVGVLITCLTAAGGHERTSAGRPPPLERYTEIPDDAIKIPLASVRQPNDYSCGAAAMMSVCRYYGVGPKKLADLEEALGTNKEIGTYFKNIVAYARQLGLESDWQDQMTVKELKTLIGRGIPVICSIQAYADDQQHYEVPDWNQDGHYVVAIGFDDANIYFMDPSITGRRGYLAWSEFKQRWHENEGTEAAPEVHQRLGIWMRPPRGGTPFLRYAAQVD